MNSTLMKACRTQCDSNSECKFYTWYKKTTYCSLFKTCTLVDHPDEPVTKLHSGRADQQSSPNTVANSTEDGAVLVKDLTNVAATINGLSERPRHCIICIPFSCMHAQNTSLIQQLGFQGGSVVTAATMSPNGGHNGAYGASNAIDSVYLYCRVRSSLD